MARLTSLLAAILVMAGTTDALAQKQGGRVPAAEPMPALRWQALVVSGDGSLPVWDNAVQRLVRGLQSSQALAGTPRRLSSAGKAAGGAPMATRDAILQAVTQMRPARGEGCLIFMTSHGIPREGLALTQSPEQPLSPQALDAALSRSGCAQAPTIVMVSACYSGDFARVLARPNRAVLTAARSDRPSFGCGAGFEYTVFDECMLETLEARPGLWAEAVTRIRRCVTGRERELNVQPSEPQASLGNQVAGLRAPLSR